MAKTFNIAGYCEPKLNYMIDFDYLKTDYEIIYMDFQTMSSVSFESEQSFVAAFSEWSWKL
ncbi:MAG: hypothetical protein K1W22_00535 [Lachnospiraceae bacterium]